MADKIVNIDGDKGIGIKYIDLGDGVHAELVVVCGPDGSPIGVSAQAYEAFYSTGYTLNANGDVVNESESNGTQTRTRSWAYVTNGDGSVTATASAWSYA